MTDRPNRFNSEVTQDPEDDTDEDPTPHPAITNLFDTQEDS